VDTSHDSKAENNNDVDIPARILPVMRIEKLGKAFKTQPTEYVRAYMRQASFRPNLSARPPTKVPNTIEEANPATNSFPTSPSLNP